MARDLPGKYLCCRIKGRILSQPLVEVEAYDGFCDKASHAHRGPTTRNAVMFGPAGYWYVFLCYGMHWMLNIVTGPKEYPAAILIRSAGEYSGPGRLTKALSAAIAVKWFVNYLTIHGLSLFAYYRVGLALLFLILAS